MDGKSASQNLL